MPLSVLLLLLLLRLWFTQGSWHEGTVAVPGALLGSSTYAGCPTLLRQSISRLPAPGVLLACGILPTLSLYTCIVPHQEWYGTPKQ
jgi:hypothetical protein